VVVIVLALAGVFGAADQYLGSLSAYPWAADVSLLSAPWLLTAFLAGCTQRDSKRAAILGFGCTVAALAGYGLMTLSPVEHAHLTSQTVRGFFVSESRVIVGGVFTGPLFGWFGYRWRVGRMWAGACLVGLAITLEPVAHELVGNPIRFATVSLGEVAGGIAMIAYVVTSRVFAGPRTSR
jgi:hypothetical protein